MSSPFPRCQIIDVVSVPQRSPFRHPAGKTWLIPHTRTWLRSLRPRPTVLVEPFAGDFLMTYDQSDEVLNLARRHGFETASIPMKNTHHDTMTELLISRNLDWLQRGRTPNQPRLF